jgi:hypothetical protein
MRRQLAATRAVSVGRAHPRAVTVLVPLLLAVLFVLATPPVGASAEVAAEPGDTVLAAEAEELGPVPQPRDAEDNAARSLGGYEDPGVQFTWAASFLLLGLVLTLLVIGGALWYLLVMRPEKQSSGTS